MRWGNVFIAEGEDYLISQPLSLVELRFHPVLINVTLLDNGSSGGGWEAKFIDITLVQDINYSPIEDFRVLVKPTVRITIPGISYKVYKCIAEHSFCIYTIVLVIFELTL